MAGASQKSGEREKEREKDKGGLVALFIRRPVSAFVLNVLIMVAGLAALQGIDVRELPDVDRPVVTVSTDFDGAAAETIDREITQKLEDAVARVSGVKTISSRSSFARSRVTVEFNDGVDLNVAAADIRDAISRVTNDLPDDADSSRIIKADSNADAVMRLAVTSTTMSVDDLTVLTEDQIVDTLSAVSGVADVQVNGDRDKIFRIDINPAKLASYGLTIADVTKTLSDMALDAPAGSLRSSSQALVVRATANISTPEEFENVYLNNRVRIGDIANVTLGPDVETSIVRVNGKPGVGLGIVRQAQSNTLDISEGIRAAVDNLNKTLPEGVQITITSDDASFIKGAIHEVEVALIVAVLSVVVIIFLFLWDLRATFIPALSIPVALIGTFAAIYLAGFSVNILTLLALVLATGLVVDDAIVVLENIVRHRNLGAGPRAAAVIGTREVFFAVIATTLTLVAVFVPISFLPGQAGGLFREFGFVLAIAILLSAIVALTLCPMLASRFLKDVKKPAGAVANNEENLNIQKNRRVQENNGQERPSGGHSKPALLLKFAHALQNFYARSLHRALDHPWIVVLLSIGFVILSAGGYLTLRQELTPSEDRAQVFLRINGPQGISVDYLNDEMRKIEEALLPFKERGEIINTYAVSGTFGSSNNGFLMLNLAPWGERHRSQQEIVQEINQIMKGFPAVRVIAAEGNSLGIRGAGQGLQFAILGTDYAKLQPVADQLVRKMQEDPRFVQPRLSVEATQPQLFIDINRERATDLGIDITGLANAVQSMLDGRKIGSVYIGDRSYDVKLVSNSTPVNDPTDLENIFMKTADDRFVPMSVVTTVKEKPVPPELGRESRMRSIALTASLAPGFALGEAFEQALELAKPLLPAGSYIIPLAEAATLSETSSGLIIVFGFALVIILLVLAAQFESFISGLIVMATVPLGLGSAVFAMMVSGVSLNVYSEIGLVLLVGIMAKNGILIVEFADQLRNRNQTLREAVENAANIRLRPVSMTMICAILGGVPLILASGAGAEARISLGFVIVGGLGLATIATLYVTPVTYLLLGRFIRPKAEEDFELEEELDAAQNAKTTG
ncbi:MULTISPECIES: efflux RND transporter permease subunit [Bartonella]|uniref:efflux RND transporter permease subunit n=1 Tax=Bartonella TaxID=773 RepID=UPI0018DE0FE6|nr:MULTISPECIES: efflux RND transporter permease subunit [Bartonella]MBH9993933.1 efflux RND transporter permease subunit [Bartonella sp. P0291]MBH9997722.1 efflux RND transporter permease subunit [Bartonella sp. M0192]MBH9999881.1 efflux RND transporter permease subunit [Bartonella sp. M0191]MBI0008125.1 efflux RND transporter permease subunit [Bartonella sp. M0193]MBI0011173.1 efflux RND transporter permease subunit [Bartonella sp. M0176]